VKTIFIMLAIGFSLACSAQVQAEDDTAARLNRQIAELKNQGKSGEAVPLAEQLVTLTRQARGDQNAETVASINTLAALYEETREYAKVEPLLKEALETRKKMLGPEHPDTATSLNNLAELYEDMSRYAEAEPLYQEALQIRQKVLGPEHPDTATSLNNLALLYVRIGNYAKADPLYHEALEIRQKVLGPENPDTATSLNNLGGLYFQMGEYDKAEPLLKEALEIDQKVLGPEDPDTAIRLNNLAELYRRIGDYAKAEPLLKEALAIHQKVFGPEHPLVASSLTLLALLYEDMAQYSKAESLFQKALDIRQKVLGPEHPDTATSLNNLALLFWRTGDYPKAEPLFKEALEIRQKVLGLENPDTTTSLSNLAVLYFEMGDYPKAELLFKQSLEICQKVLGPENPDTVADLNNLALLYQRMGNYAKAEPLLKEALESHQKILGPEHPDTASSINNLAELYEDMGDYAKAEPLFRQSLEIRQKVLGREHPITALSLNNLALLYHEMGDYAKAEPLYKEALEIRQKVLGPGHPDTAISLNNLAGLYQQMGDYAKAEPLFKEALEIRQKVLGPGHPDTAITLNNLAELYRRMGELSKAEALLKEALEIYQKVLGPENPLTASGLNNLALIYQDMGDYAKAEPLFKEALEVRQKVLGPERRDTATSFNNLALLEFDLGQIEEGKRLAQQGYLAELKAFSQILSFGSEDQRLAYRRLLTSYTLLTAVDPTVPLLAGAVLHYKGVVLDSIIEDRLLAETSKDEASRALLEELKAKKQALAKLLLQTTAASPKDANERIQALEQEVEGIQDTLVRQFADVGQARRALAVTVQQVQAAIPKNAVLIEYVRYQHYLGKSKFELRYGAVVLSADAMPRWVTLGRAQEIEASLRRYQRLVREAGDGEMAAILREVYKEVWEPVEQAFPPNVNRVIVSPDGQLNFLSFATLLDADQGFVAEKYSIQYVTSGRDLLRAPQPTQGKQVIIMSNPKFDRDIELAGRVVAAEGSSVLRGVEKREVEDLTFEELAGTQKEGAQLLRKFERWGWQTRSLTGSDVSKRAFLDLHSPFILHLATHGFFEPEDVSSDPDPNEPQSLGIKSDLTKSRFFENPMHRSGLALAGANTTIEAWKRGEASPIEDDGILTAEDVSTLDLKGTWLVTLSACDTGSGEARAGEGVMGLRRGFIEAGAQNLLMTLWPISDEVTVQIMSDFYEAAHERGSAPEALAKVQREWLVKLRKEQGLANAVNLAGPFIMSSQGKP
jgi:tetratricopeptide (TPR) repeat protein